VRSKRILVIENDQMVRMVIAMHLRAQAFTADEAGSPQEALGLWRHYGKEYDLIIADFDLHAQTNGYELIQKFCGESPGLKGVLISGVLMDGFVVNTSIADRVVYFRKPFQCAELLNVVRQLLNPPGAAEGGPGTAHPRSEDPKGMPV